MQRMFLEPTPWQTPWMARVLPRIGEIVAAHPAETIFTRFMPPQTASEMHGNWRHYYERWKVMTLEHLPPEQVDLVPPLNNFVPPATVIDKKFYGPWIDTDLHALLQSRHVNTIVITGCETDICVMAAMIGAVDLGYRVIIVTDAICSSSDRTHDAMLHICHERFAVQVEPVDTATVLKNWPSTA